MKKAANILGITWITSKYHFSGTTGTSGCREAGRAVGGKDVILLQHPLRWEWRCPGSFIISSLILFNMIFGIQVPCGFIFLSVRMLLFFAGKFGACGGLMDVQLWQHWASALCRGEKSRFRDLFLSAN